MGAAAGLLFEPELAGDPGTGLGGPWRPRLGTPAATVIVEVDVLVMVETEFVT
jgi:hypothetical protein